MAIEFQCPYCSATIRVADQYCGKSGTCPKCRQKLIIPTPGVPDSAPPAAGGAAAPVNPAAAAAPAPESAAGSVPAAGPESPGAAADMAATLPEQILFTAPAEPPSVARKLRRKRRRRSQNVYRIGIPVICLAVFVGVLALIMVTVNQAPDLTGELVAQHSGAGPLEPVSVDPARLALSADEMAQVLSLLEADPAAFLSSQMSCQVGAADGLLTVAVNPASGYRWFVVDPTGNRDLLGWIRDQRAGLEQLRTAQLEAAGTDFCRDQLQAAKSGAVISDPARFRDEFALNARCDAFGFAVQAIAADRVARCAYETPAGLLYFALPESTTSFKLQGRSVGNPNLKFPGEYQVRVAETATVPESPDLAPEVESADGAEPAADEQMIPESMPPDENPDEMLNGDAMPMTPEPMSPGSMSTPKMTDN